MQNVRPRRINFLPISFSNLERSCLGQHFRIGGSLTLPIVRGYITLPAVQKVSTSSMRRIYCKPVPFGGWWRIELSTHSKGDAVEYSRDAKGLKLLENSLTSSNPKKATDIYKIWKDCNFANKGKENDYRDRLLKYFTSSENGLREILELLNSTPLPQYSSSDIYFYLFALCRTGPIEKAITFWTTKVLLQKSVTECSEGFQLLMVELDNNKLIGQAMTLWHDTVEIYGQRDMRTYFGHEINLMLRSTIAGIPNLVQYCRSLCTSHKNHQTKRSIEFCQWVCGEAIVYLSSNKKIKQAMEVLQFCHKSDWHMRTSCYVELIARLCKRGRFSDALRIYEQMKEKKIKPSIITFNSLLQIYSEQIDSANLQKTLNEMGENNILPNEWTFDLTMRCFAEKGDAETVENLYKQYLEMKYPHKKSIFSFLILVRVKRLEKEETLKWYQKMKIIGISADLRIYTHLMQLFTQLNDVDGALATFRAMLNNSIEPTESVYSMLITMFAKRKDVEAAEKMYSMMIERGTTGSTTAPLISLMSAYVAVDEFEKAEEAMQHLLDQKSTLISPWSILLQGYARKGEMGKFYDLYDKMKAHKVKMDTQNYAIMLDAICKHKSLSSGLEFLDSIEDKNYKPNEYIYTILMNASLKEGDTKSVQSWYNMMKNNGIKPTHITQSILMKCLVNDPDDTMFDVAKKVLHNIESSRSHYDSTSRIPPKSALTPHLYVPLLSGSLKRQGPGAAKAIFDQFLEKSASSEGVRAQPDIWLLNHLLYAYQFDAPLEVFTSVWRDIKEKTDKLSRRTEFGMRDLEQSFVLPKLKNVICIPLSVYIVGLRHRGEYGLIKEVWQQHVKDGYIFDSANWNDRIQSCAQALQDLEWACEQCDKILVDDWVEWNRKYLFASVSSDVLSILLQSPNEKDFVLDRKRNVKSGIKDLPHRPTLKALEIAFDLLKGGANSIEDGVVKSGAELLTSISANSPRVMEVVKLYQNLYDLQNR